MIFIICIENTVSIPVIINEKAILEEIIKPEDSKPSQHMVSH